MDFTFSPILCEHEGSLRRRCVRTCMSQKRCTPQFFSRTKNQPKEEVFGTDIPRTSRVIRADIPALNFGQGAQNPRKKNEHLGADILDPKARTSTTLRDFQTFRSEKLRAEFSFPNFGSPFRSHRWLASDRICWTTTLTCIPSICPPPVLEAPEMIPRLVAMLSTGEKIEECTRESGMCALCYSAANYYLPDP